MSPSRSHVQWVPALLVLMLAHGFFLYSWAKKNNTPLAWDQVIHTKIAMDYREQIGNEPFLNIFRPKSFSYPPLYHLAMIPALGWVTDISEAGLPVNFFYLCVLIVAVFLIGRDLMGPWEGFTAAALVTCYPNIVWISQNTLIDLSLTAWVTVTFYCLLRSKNFTELGPSALFGVALGFSMLTKWTAFAYLIAPMPVAIAQALREGRWRNVLIAFVLCGAVMAPWYMQNVIPVAVQLPVLSGLPPASGEVAGLAKLFWYPLSLDDQMGKALAALLVPGVVAIAWRPKILPIVLWFFGTLLFFSLLRNKNVRYFAPALPAAALLTAAWLPSIFRVAYGAALAVALFGFVSYAKSQPVESGSWRHVEIIEKVRDLHGESPTPAMVLVVANEPYLHGGSLRMTARSRGDNAVTFKSPGKSRPFEFVDFVLTKTGSLGPGFTLGNIDACDKEIKRDGGWFPKTFKEKARWPLPDGSEAVLYHCDPSPEKFSEAGLFNLSLKEMDLPRIKAYDVEMRVVPISPADTRLGRFKQLDVKSGRIVYNSIEFRDVELHLRRPQVNMPLFYETQQIQLSRLGAMEPHATIHADGLLKLVAKKAAWLKDPVVRFEGDKIDVSGVAAGIPLAVSVSVEIKQKTLYSRILDIRIAGMPVPLIFVRGVVNRVVPLERGAEWSYDIVVASVKGDGASLRVGS